MNIGESRQETIRARVFDLHKIACRAADSTYVAHVLKSDLYGRLAMAHAAFSVYRSAVSASSKTGQLASGCINPEDLLDQVKTILECDIPLLLLLCVPPADRRKIAAEVVEMVRHFGVAEGDSNGAGPLSTENAGSRFSHGTFVELATWFDAIVAATIEVDRGGWLAMRQGGFS